MGWRSIGLILVVLGCLRGEGGGDSLSESVLPLIGMVGVQDRQPGAFGNFDLWRAAAEKNG
jgi:hypothetical protein